MIISASRRTDIPSYYSEWFFNRIKEGYVLVRSPMNAHLIWKFSLSPDVIDGIVFWTKNPLPMIDRLGEIEKFPYYFQFTLNAYGKDAEPTVPLKSSTLIPAFIQLSSRIGKERVVWRYDPIFFNKTYTPEYHCKYFRELAGRLGGYTEKCTVSFLDQYKNTAHSMKPLHIFSESLDRKKALMQKFSEVARENGITIDACAEKEDFGDAGVTRAHCIDKERLERIGGCKLAVEKDKNQRCECGCATSIDIGSYNTCKNGCLYCYANDSLAAASKNFHMHNPHSPLLFGEIGPNDMIKERTVYSFKDSRITLF